ncbi:MAG: N-acetylmuramoyl-L-alanine amidase [Clostridia bacterium]|nr:N-acetylmuramoyl-L-alanine amidase [Clostridia bacterium]
MRNYKILSMFFLLSLTASCMLSGCRLHAPKASPGSEAVTSEALPMPSQAPVVPQTTQAPTEQETQPPEKLLIVIDPGHQLHADMSQEPLGPGSSELKFRVSGGTAGYVTGLAEHELNLSVSFLLRELLLDRGYEVVLTREEADVSMSNAERAAIANDLQADAFIRIHANGSENHAEHGALTICMTASNPFNAELHDESYALCENILECMCATSGAKQLYIWETDTMTGINYSQVPVCIVEMGFMTNPDEDRLMATEDYQRQLATGIADGIDRYFEVTP